MKQCDMGIMECVDNWAVSPLFENGANVGDSVMSVETKFKTTTTDSTSYQQHGAQSGWRVLVRSCPGWTTITMSWRMLEDKYWSDATAWLGMTWSDVVGLLSLATNPTTWKNFSNETGVTGVFLHWKDFNMPGHTWNSADDDADLLVGKFYPWVGADKFCRYLTGDNLTRHCWDIVCDHVCTIFVFVYVLLTCRRHRMHAPWNCIFSMQCR